MNLLFFLYVFLFSLEYTDFSQNYSVIENPSDMAEGIESDSYLARVSSLPATCSSAEHVLLPFLCQALLFCLHISAKASLSPSLPHCSSIINLRVQ